MKMLPGQDLQVKSLIQKDKMRGTALPPSVAEQYFVRIQFCRTLLGCKEPFRIEYHRARVNLLVVQKSPT